MTTFTAETVPTQFIEAKGVKYACRRFGKPNTVPIVCLGYFASNMDMWDPAVTNSLAADYEIILFDNAGVGASGGKTPNNVDEMTQHVVAFIQALGLKKVHIMGFSLGGMIAQTIAIDHPQLVDHLLLLGTCPRGGEDLTFTELSPEEQENPVSLLLTGFFTKSEASQVAGHEFVKRVEGCKEKDLPVSRDSAAAQLAAIREWGIIPKTDRYSTLAKISHPTLIVHGNHDIVVTPINALILATHLPNAQLIMYPDSNHGAQYQHNKKFVEHVRVFLKY